MQRRNFRQITSVKYSPFQLTIATIDRTFTSCQIESNMIYNGTIFTLIQLSRDHWGFIYIGIIVRHEKVCRMIPQHISRT